MARNRFAAQHGQMNLIAVFVVLAVVGAIVAVPFVFMGRQETDNAKTALSQVDTANDASAEVMLTDALRGAQTWWAENGTMQGYGPTQAAEFEPQGRYDSSPTAQAQHISIRGADTDSVVLVTLGGSGPLCVGIKAGVVSYGRVDAASAAQCVGSSWT